MAKLPRYVIIILVGWCIIYVPQFLNYVGIMVYHAQHMAIFLGLILTLTFVAYPARKGGTAGKWYDWLLIVMSLVPCAYVVSFFDLWQLHGATKPATYEVVFFIMLAIALLEALRRVVGLILVAITFFFMVHPLIGNYMPGILFSPSISLERAAYKFYLPPPGGFFNIPLEIASTIVITFLLFGELLLYAGGGKTMMDLTLAVIGRLRGGAAKGAVVASGLFGTLSGSVSANVATIGTFTIPMMKNTGYSPAFAGGIEACSSNGGQLMPPVMGAVAFVMAEVTGISYYQIALVAFIPAILYYLFMFLQVDFEAARAGLKGLPASQIPSFKNTLRDGWHYIFPIAVLVYTMFFLYWSPELSAFWTAVSVLVVTAFNKKTRLGISKLMECAAGLKNAVVMIGVTCAMAGVIMGSLSITGVALLLSAQVVELAAGNLFFLLVMTAIICFIFGMGMPSIPCYIFVAIMVAPVLVDFGIPLIAAHLFVFYLALGSFITPPVALAAYVAAAIAEADPQKVAFCATRIGIGIFIVPFAFVYNPALLLIGSPVEIATAIVVSVIGIIAMSAGLEGYLLRRIGWALRISFIVAGFAVFIPILWIRLSALGILALFFVWQLKGVRVRFFRRVTAAVGREENGDKEH